MLINQTLKGFQQKDICNSKFTPLDLLCLVLLFSLLNRTLLISFWAYCLGQLLAWNHDFISSKCLSKSVLL